MTDENLIVHSNCNSLISIAKWCLIDILNIKCCHINIYMSDFSDTNVYWTGHFVPCPELSTNRIIINTKGNSYYEDRVIQTLFHELRHYYQYENNLFQVRNIFGKSSKKTFTHEEYQSLDWELDACQFAVETIGKWKNYKKSQY